MMLVEELQIDADIVAKLKEQGIDKLYPTQSATVPSVLQGRNVVVAVPTASGKSLIGYMALLRAARLGQKGMYIVPLRALASEKYEELKAFEPLGIKVAISTGDYDSTGERLGRYDIIVATSEKADSLLRHGAAWISKLSVVVVDEIHLINEPDRGPTLEMVITRLRTIAPNIQVVGLSATIKNSTEIAEWLDAEHYSSDWRPVKLREGVYSDSEIFFTDNERRKITKRDGEDLWSLIYESIAGGGQSLVFVNTRKNTESAALKYRHLMAAALKAMNESELPSEEEIEDDMEETGAVKGILNDCLRAGIAFHHAGLTNAQRQKVERLFKQKKVKCLFATPTLAAGINLPARTVIVRDLYRYDSHMGNTLIPVVEVKQMCGRAGRPRFDDYGEAIVIAKNSEMASFVLEEYLLGEAEKINSQIGNERSLRNHVLSAVATRIANNMRELREFLSLTFYAYQFDVETLERSAVGMLRYLQDNGMISGDGEQFRATVYGKRVSDLYIDPKTAIMLREAVERFKQGKELGLLHAICTTPDMIPLYSRNSDTEKLLDAAENRRNELIFTLDEAEDEELYLSELKTALMLKDWISEAREDSILADYGIYPGDLRNKAETATWLLYSAEELAQLDGLECSKSIGHIAMRVEKGVSERLLDIASLRGIGRVRAIALFTHGFRTRRDISAATEDALVAVPGIGRQLARSLIEQSRRTRKTIEPVAEGTAIPKDWFFDEEG